MNKISSVLKESSDKPGVQFHGQRPLPSQRPEFDFSRPVLAGDSSDLSSGEGWTDASSDDEPPPLADDDSSSDDEPPALIPFGANAFQSQEDVKKKVASSKPIPSVTDYIGSDEYDSGEIPPLIKFGDNTTSNNAKKKADNNKEKATPQDAFLDHCGEGDTKLV